MNKLKGQADTTRILIATACRPMTAAKAAAFNEELRKNVAKIGLFIPQGIWWTHGSGCANLAFDVQLGTEKEREKVGFSLCMGLQPAKWSTTTDDLPEADQYDFDED